MRSEKKTNIVVKKETNFGAEVIDSLKDFFAAVDRGDTITVRDIKLDLEPASYTPQEIKSTRAKLNLSQGALAKLLAVDVKTVQSWEHGERPPGGPVRRLLDEMNQEPKRWIRQLEKRVQCKASGAC